MFPQRASSPADPGRLPHFLRPTQRLRLLPLPPDRPPDLESLRPQTDRAQSTARNRDQQSTHSRAVQTPQDPTPSPTTNCNPKKLPNPCQDDSAKSAHAATDSARSGLERTSITTKWPTSQPSTAPGCHQGHLPSPHPRTHETHSPPAHQRPPAQSRAPGHKLAQSQATHQPEPKPPSPTRTTAQGRHDPRTLSPQCPLQTHSSTARPPSQQHIAAATEHLRAHMQPPEDIPQSHQGPPQSESSVTPLLAAS
ncbi:extensin-like [Austrofundulus limnaeus]|uniref:Extensin-like n=1 Tax=Austrofundulus limnaeus TaxID=52670 RepID=A0A2I4CQ31_AUSLI|nr:PREDICTED: extensin-like [Austrofundulus limnaeus]